MKHNSPSQALSSSISPSDSLNLHEFTPLQEKYSTLLSCGHDTALEKTLRSCRTSINTLNGHSSLKKHKYKLRSPNSNKDKHMLSQGSRNIIRLPNFKPIDLNKSKIYKMIMERRALESNFKMAKKKKRKKELRPSKTKRNEESVFITGITTAKSLSRSLNFSNFLNVNNKKDESNIKSSQITRNNQLIFNELDISELGKNNTIGPQEPKTDPSILNSGQNITDMVFTDTSSIGTRDYLETMDEKSQSITFQECTKILDIIDNKNWEYNSKLLVTTNEDITAHKKLLHERDLQICDEPKQGEILTQVHKLNRERSLNFQMEQIKLIMQAEIIKDNEIQKKNMTTKHEEEINEVNRKYKNIIEMKNIENELLSIEKVKYQTSILENKDRFHKLKEDRWKLLTEKEKISMGAKETLADFEMMLLNLNFELSAKSKEINILKEKLKKAGLVQKTKNDIYVMIWMGINTFIFLLIFLVLISYFGFI